LANLTRPEAVKEIHLEYIKSGAKLIRTNTFAANLLFLESMEQVKHVIEKGYAIANEAVLESGQEVFVAADIGPVYDTGFDGEEVILEHYYGICDCFLESGSRIFVFETQSEFTYLEKVTAYVKHKQPEAYVIVQFSVDKSGYTRHGLSIDKIIDKAANIESIDAYGFNCGVGAAHLYQLLKDVEFPNRKPVTALPNAGYPMELRGKTVFRDNKKYFVETVEKIAELGIEILGGCCGTTPEYIGEVATRLHSYPIRHKRVGSDVKVVEEKWTSPIEKKLKSDEKVFIVELDPPFDTNISKVMTGARELKEAGIDWLTLSDSPMARTRMDAGKLAAKVQREVGIPVMPHICCRDKNVIGMRAGLLGDYMNELRHFLIVTGDPVPREAKGSVTPVFDFNSIRLMEYVSVLNADVFHKEPVLFGGALNYHGSNPDAIIRRMKQKTEQGCKMFLTQPIYSKEDIERIRYIKENINAKVMCGIMPLVSYKNAVFMTNEMPGVHIPEEIVDRYTPDMTREEAEQVGIEIAVEIAEKLKNIADGYYFMTPFNRTGMMVKIIRKIQAL